MIIVLKLINGDNVIGLLALEDEWGFTIQDPFTIEHRVDMKGYRNMVLHRYNPFSQESTIAYKHKNIISVYTADDDLSDYYFYTLDHACKFRDKAMSHDIQRACEYIQKLIDENDNADKPVEDNTEQEDVMVVPSTKTFH